MAESKEPKALDKYNITFTNQEIHKLLSLLGGAPAKEIGTLYTTISTQAMEQEKPILKKVVRKSSKKSK